MRGKYNRNEERKEEIRQLREGEITDFKTKFKIKNTIKLKDIDIDDGIDNDIDNDIDVDNADLWNS